MGNCCRSTPTSMLSTRNDTMDGTPPGLNPAVLLDICYWEGGTSTNLATGADEGVAATVIVDSTPNYDNIATSIHSSLHLFAQVSVRKEDGYCRRLCESTDTCPKPVVQVIVTAETSSHWQGHYAEGLKTLIETEWKSYFGKDYFAQIIDHTNQTSKQ